MKVYIVNAFTRDNAGGSPTGVVADASGLSGAEMQAIARQTGVSHTAFVTADSSPEATVSIRFFTPGEEILNCGHGTIAAHYVRAVQLQLQGDHIIYQQAKAGLQQVIIRQQGTQLFIYLRQNQIQFTDVPPVVKDRLLAVTGLLETDLAAGFPVVMASPGANRFLAGLHSRERLYDINPDFSQLRQLCDENQALGCFVWHLSGNDASARMFAPSIGVNEDIINGNSSGCLGAYLLQRQGLEQLDLAVYQGEPQHCPGVVNVQVRKNGAAYNTLIGGTAAITGEILL
ncbi:PhzF family phenazine biosynthesis protein [Chitinophaga solisilvae]|uniref:PhzF family phenazine biosynthesis protein n=1 Tax=Chitinophaga solisilvae TaxID=1233460 RepID=UPI00136E8FEB|nr:PhzF family phenazine biosynthesis isomerase [Chitinophaga solisilvae]